MSYKWVDSNSVLLFVNDFEDLFCFMVTLLDEQTLNNEWEFYQIEWNTIVQCTVQEQRNS